MPKDNIDRAIKKALGGEADTMEEIRYEGFAPGGVGLIVEVLTDNRNRAAANVRAVFTKAGGNLGETGSVSFMFDRLGEITYPPRGRLGRCGDGGRHRGGRRGRGERRRGPHDLRGVRGPRSRRRGAGGGAGAGSGRRRSGARRASAGHGDEVAKLVKLIEGLEDDDDVQNVFGNFEMSDEVLKKLTAA